MMNRRLFLTSYPLYINQTKRTTLKPVITQKINDTDTVFVSQNKKLVINNIYEDYGDSVFVINNIEWEDPITQSVMRRTDRNIYILETKDT